MYYGTILFVAPAKAGVQGRETERLPWIPAFAGMTRLTGIAIGQAATGLGARTPKKWQIATIRSARLSV